MVILISISTFIATALLVWAIASTNTGKGSAPPHATGRPTIEKSQVILLGATMALCLFFAFYFNIYPLIAVGVVLPVLPLIYRFRKRKIRHDKLYFQMDGMLANLANAVRVTGNLYIAVEDVADGEMEPMREELYQVLHQIRLGQSEEDALHNLAQRCGIPLLRTAIGAVIVGKRSGGNLGQILASTASGIREIKRLEGVLKTKTSEARSQAWVMGLVPFVLCGLLEMINPEWLDPMWSTPFGWLLLACCVILEVAAIFLIRKILSVAL
ncbi:MAG: type II secretion system F family protein [Deltaproteobacteria bacterium]|nr:type II secretion system F family protein [Deltaproteobacteria bacterium]